MRGVKVGNVRVVINLLGTTHSHRAQLAVSHSGLVLERDLAQIRIGRRILSGVCTVG